MASSPPPRTALHMLCSPRVSGAYRTVMNRLNSQRTAFIPGMIILGICGVGGQTLPLRDPSVAQRPLAPRSAADPVVPGFEETERTELPAPKNENPAFAQQAAIDGRGAPKLVSVARLMEIVANAKGKDNSESAREIDHLRLTERLSSAKLAALSAALPETKSKNALMAVADASVFLEPPANEIPDKPAPDLAERDEMISMALDYLNKINPKLPDFYANRITTSFEEAWTPKEEKGGHAGQGLHTKGKFRATVYYRGGKEVLREQGKHEHGLITRGTFGPILRVVFLDARQSNTTQWSRWEEGPSGPMAVFRFHVPETESHYTVSGSLQSDTMGPTAYHGEIGIDPSSGTILRLMLEADPELGSTIERAGVMVEYGSVEIGGKTYTCPLRSVSYSVGVVGIPAPLDIATSWKRKAARLNDVVFSDYHVFRSELRIVP